MLYQPFGFKGVRPSGRHQQSWISSVNKMGLCCNAQLGVVKEILNGWIHLLSYGTLFTWCCRSCYCRCINSGSSSDSIGSLKQTFETLASTHIPSITAHEYTIFWSASSFWMRAFILDTMHVHDCRTHVITLFQNISSEAIWVRIPLLTGGISLYPKTLKNNFIMCDIKMCMH